MQILNTQRIQDILIHISCDESDENISQPIFIRLQRQGKGDPSSYIIRKAIKELEYLEQVYKRYEADQA